jgi:dephospho-CoA kinase
LALVKVLSVTFLVNGAYMFLMQIKSLHILFKNETAQNEIIAEFGTDVLGLNKKIDNQKLANIAFQSEEYQMRLNAIMHPYIFKEIDNTISLISKTKKV